MDCLSAYLLLGQQLLEGKRDYAEAWNFGPESNDCRSVATVLGILQRHWPELRWHRTQQPQPHEAGLLALDSSRARVLLQWKPTWNLEQALAATASWYRHEMATKEPLTRQQLASYADHARTIGASWAL
jgi:CDP-glucose 4,6-dehydratase